MSRYFLLIWMLFNHVLDDYTLQGILSQMKQKSWWKKNAPDKEYEYDYIMALLMHGISWSFMIMLPIAVYVGFKVNLAFFLMFLFNAALHAAIDHLKANEFVINLVADQCLHIVQILITFTLAALPT